MDTKNKGVLPYLEIEIEKISCFKSVYRKPIHAGFYLNFLSNHSYSTRKGIIKTLIGRAKTISSISNALSAEKQKLKTVLRRYGYPEDLIDKTIEECLNTRTRAEEVTHSRTVILPYPKDFSKKKRIGYQYELILNNPILNIFTKIKPKSRVTSKNCTYSVPCDCEDL